MAALKVAQASGGAISPLTFFATEMQAHEHI
jgi:hypothetical protein